MKYSRSSYCTTKYGVCDKCKNEDNINLCMSCVRVAYNNEPMFLCGVPIDRECIT